MYTWGELFFGIKVGCKKNQTDRYQRSFFGENGGVLAKVFVISIKEYRFKTSSFNLKLYLRAFLGLRMLFHFHAIKGYGLE